MKVFLWSEGILNLDVGEFKCIWDRNPNNLLVEFDTEEELFDQYCDFSILIFLNANVFTKYRQI